MHGSGRGPRDAAPAEVVRATKRLNAECAERGDVKGARALIENLILSRGYYPTLVTANVLVKTYRVARMPEGAEHVLNELPSWGLQPDGCTYSTIVDAYGLSGRDADARRIASRAEACGCADSRVYSALLRFVQAGEVEGILERLISRGVGYNTALCNAALTTLASAGRAAEAKAFVSRFMAPLKSTNPGAHHHGGRQPPGWYQSQRGVRADPRTHALVLKAHCTAGDAAEAEALIIELLAQGESVDAAAVSTVMNAYVSQEPPDLQGAYRLMQTAATSGLSLDVAVYNILIKGYANVKPPQPEKAQAVLEDIRRVGLVPSLTSICSVMDAWCEANNEARAQQLMERCVSEGLVQHTAPLYNTLIKASSRCRCKRARGLCKCNPCGCCQPERGMALLAEMATNGLQPDAITISTLLDAFCSAGKLAQAWLLLESLLMPQLSRGGGMGGGGVGGSIPGGGPGYGQRSKSASHGSGCSDNAQAGTVPMSSAGSPTPISLSAFSTIFRATLRYASRESARAGGGGRGEGGAGGGSGGGGGGVTGSN